MAGPAIGSDLPLDPDAALSGRTVARQRWGVSVDGEVMYWAAATPLGTVPDLSSMVECYRVINPDAVIVIVPGSVMSVPVEWL